MKQIYVYGTDEHINKLVEIIKNTDLIDKGKIHLIDLMPELTEEYKDDNGINCKLNIRNKSRVKTNEM